MILPSILEYTEEATKDRFILLKSLSPETTQTDEWHLHIDIILPDFATERDVKSSWNPLTTILKAQELSEHLTIHIMGEHPETNRFLDDLKHTPLTEGTIVFLPLGVTSDLPLNIGYWYDVDQWDQELETDHPTLLMTVKAGLSGQTADPEKKQLATAFSRKSIYTTVLDGGWNIEEDQEGLMIVSYGSYWSSVK